MRAVIVICANALVWLFLLDAVVTVVDTLWSGDPERTLTFIRNRLARVVMVLAGLWLVLLVMFGHLLKRWHLFWLAVGTFWLNFGAQPIGLFFDGSADPAYALLLGVTQLLIAVATILRIRGRCGDWILNGACLITLTDGVLPWGGRLVGRFLALVLLFFVYLPFYLITQVGQLSAGYLGFSWQGIYVRDVEFSDSDGRLLRLVATMHVGEPVFYEAMLESFEQPRTLILEEGVRDRSRLLGLETRGRRRLQRYAPLSMQPSMTEVRGAHPISSVAERTEWVNVLNADVDLADLSDATRRWAIESSRVLEAVRQGKADLLQLLVDDATAPLTQEVYASLLFQRNEHLIRVLASAQDAFQQIVIPWGALHMPDLARRVSEMGWEPTGRQRRHELIRWRTFWALLRGEGKRLQRKLTLAELERLANQGADAMQAGRRPALRLSPVRGERSNPEVDVRFGGLPTRFVGEVWPRNLRTGRPMSFVFELERTDISAPFLGDIRRLRLFVDYDTFGAVEDESSYALWITRVDDEPAREVQWTGAELAALEKDFTVNDDQIWSALSWPEIPLQPESMVTADVELMRSRSALLERDSRRDWYRVSDRVLAEFSERFPDTIVNSVDTRLGGYPVWLQGPDDQQLPFFLQVYPEGDMMWGGGGVFYLFLDPANPTANRMIGQMD
ncbi:MAG: DUF1963 domain-containing protein [Pseudomonadota bacterium]